MLKKILVVLSMLYAMAAFAAVDVNKASPAELDGIKGIGPSISAKIVDERKKGQFKDWPDFISRVSGVGEVTAAKFSQEGLTVNGTAFKGAPAAKPAAASAAKDKTAAAAKPSKADAAAASKADAAASKK